MEHTEMTLGRRIAALRKDKSLRQDDLAENLGVSPQAVSKWENDNSCPDITLLPALAKILGVTVDELLSGKQPPVAQLLPVEKRRSIDDMLLRITVDSHEGDKVRVNLPMAILKVFVGSGLPVQIGAGDALKNIDFSQIITLVENGMVGNLVDVESADGDIVHIFVE